MLSNLQAGQVEKHSSAQDGEFTTLGKLLRWRAEHQPDKLAFAFLKEGLTQDQELTYASLDQQARAVAGYLRDRIPPGHRALLIFPPGLDFIAAFCGCLYAGVIAVPAPPSRPDAT